jgi:hypothetical protein
MAGERHLSLRREDSQAVVGPSVRWRADERRLGQVGPSSDRLHLLARYLVGIEYYCDGVALEWHGSEHIHLLESQPLHHALLFGRSRTGRRDTIFADGTVPNRAILNRLAA